MYSYTPEALLEWDTSTGQEYSLHEVQPHSLLAWCNEQSGNVK